jgi:hypothetical protein
MKPDFTLIGFTQDAAPLFLPHARTSSNRSCLAEFYRRREVEEAGQPEVNQGDSTKHRRRPESRVSKASSCLTRSCHTRACAGASTAARGSFFDAGRSLEPVFGGRYDFSQAGPDLDNVSIRIRRSLFAGRDLISYSLSRSAILGVPRNFISLSSDRGSRPTGGGRSRTPFYRATMLRGTILAEGRKYSIMGVMRNQLPKRDSPLWARADWRRSRLKEELTLLNKGIAAFDRAERHTSVKVRRNTARMAWPRVVKLAAKWSRAS